jgi:hypothetical protein
MVPGRSINPEGLVKAWISHGGHGKTFMFLPSAKEVFEVV